MSSDSIHAIAGYAVMEQLGETDCFSIHRAGKAGEPAPLLLKLIKTKAPSAARMARFKHECALIRGLDTDGIVKLLDVIEFEGKPGLILEDVRATPLKEILADGMDLERFLDLAIRLSQILGIMHQANVSHRNIKPLNILLDPEKNLLKIADFGIYTEIVHSYEEMVNAPLMAGNLAYISPEQTGRMNCGVDYRVDFYALGVTFYEMLTGKAPFHSENPIELIHAHIAKLPVSPREARPDLPEAVSDIVLKLLSKSADDRYQSAFGLATDLRECLRQLRQSGRIERFVLGSQDMSPDFILPNRLVGRDKERNMLHEAFERVCLGTVESVLVIGEHGIGKSALINEIHQPIALRHGYFITGKFDPFHRAVPYSALIQAFQHLTRQLLAEDDERLRQWRERLLTALGPNGKIVTDMVPEFERIIGKQPDVPSLEPEQNQNRFNLCFKNFVRVFADRAHPLVLFLDDLQWADSASLKLLETIVADRGLHYLLFVGAYQDAEVSGQHTLTGTRMAFQGAGIPVHALSMKALDPEETHRFITAFMHCDADASLAFAQAIHAKTKGNPFFIHQFLKTLRDKRLLWLDPARGWRWDLDKIAQLQATDNVMQFMTDKLHALPAPALRVIQHCACIGNRFDLETLASICERSIDESLAILDGLMQDGLVHRMGDYYRFYDNRIQTAAYSLVPAAERESIHYRIGRLDLARTSSEDLLQRIFYICDQLNQAGACLVDPDERIRLAELNLQAGNKAKESAAYGAAVDYLVAGCALLAKDTWQTDYKLAYALFSKQMECQYLNRNFEEAQRLFEIIIANCTTRRDQAEAYHVMIVLYTNMRSPREAIALGLKALTLFDIHISADIGPLGVLKELIVARHRMRRIGIEKLMDLPLIDDPELAACLDLIFAVGTPAYYFNENLFAKLALMGLNMALRHGGTVRYAPVAFISLATIIQSIWGDYALGYRLGDVALKLHGRFNDRKTTGMIHHIFAFFILHWKHHARQSVDLYHQAYQLSIDAGDFIFAGHSSNAAIDCGLMIGTPLDELLAENKKHDELMKIIKDPFIAMRHVENDRLILALKGQTDSRYSLAGPDYDEDAYSRRLREENNRFGLCYTLFYKMRILFLFGKFEQARQVAAELDTHIKVQMGTLMQAEHYFYYSMILTALMTQTHRKKLKYRIVLRRNQHKMREWAALCPDNFQHKHDLVAAETMRLKGRHRDAHRLYHAAIEGARLNGYLHLEALACERLALSFLADAGEEEAGMFMRRAYRCYASWGAKAKTDQLTESYPSLVGASKTEAAVHVQDNPGVAQTVPRNLDFSTVLQAAQVIASEIELEPLLRKTMHLSMANAGAQRGCLIFEAQGRLSVRAMEDMDSGEQQVPRAMPLETCASLSPAIVNYVYHSGEALILANASAQGAFKNDPHVLRHGCKSILCLPILNKGTLACILYMENNLTAEAFTPERLEILRILTSQAAISLDNARLYKDLSTEIAVRKEAEEAVRTSEEKFRTMLEEMQDAYCEINLLGTITFVNPSACALSGRSRSELIGTDIRILAPESTREGLGRYFHEILATGRPGKPFSIDLVDKNGATIFLEIVSSLMYDKSGKVIGFRNVGRDVSERRRLEQDLFESYKNVQTARTATILGLAKLAEYRDEDTGTHLERIREYARVIARELSTQDRYRGYITEAYIEDIYTSAILHDIGKVGVPDAVLLKPGKLTREEFEIIKTHATLGGDVLSDLEAKIEGQTFLTLGKEIAYYHHEKWDGTGYPKGLKEERIPLSARIVAIADVYDALTSKRTYKEAFTHRQALEIIVKDRGTHFAPEVVDAFLAHEEEFRRIREELLGDRHGRRRAG